MARSFSPSRRRLTALRLTALKLTPRLATEVAPLVRHLLALQAQDYSGALWSIGLRTGATRAQVEAAQASGSIVRSWPMRGTLHFVAAEDLGWLLSLTSARIIRGAAGRHRQLELSDADFERAAAIARERLSGGMRLERADLLAAFEAGGVSIAGQRGVHLLNRLAISGLAVMCGQNSWALLDEWVPNPRHLERADALREFALRYFTSHGPATLKDFSWWSSLSLTESREGLALAREQLDELELDGDRYYLRPGLEPAKPAAHLLPGFDEFLLGYSDRSAPLAGAAADIVVPGGNGVFLPTIVVNGEVVGTWRRTTKPAKTIVSVTPFRALPTSSQSALARDARLFARFLETEVELVPGASQPTSV